MERRRFLVCAGLLAAGSVLVNARPPSGRAADEAQIRSILASYDGGETMPMSSDVILASPALSGPQSGADAVERALGKVKWTGQPGSIAVNDARDLAFDYGAIRLTNRAGAALRLWRKEEGRWRLAALWVESRSTMERPRK